MDDSPKPPRWPDRGEDIKAAVGPCEAEFHHVHDHDHDTGSARHERSHDNDHDTSSAREELVHDSVNVSGSACDDRDVPQEASCESGTSIFKDFSIICNAFHDCS